jgi:tetratricopeptide (TPR) repeat protein
MGKKYFSILLTLILSSHFSNQNLEAKEIQWQTSILKAMEIAKKENKPIFVELYADWCNYCKELEAIAFPDPKVQVEINRFIPVRLNGEEYPNFMDRYDVQGFPTLLFLDPYANFISRLSGLPTKEMIVREARSAIQNSDIESKLILRWKKNPESIQANFELGVYYYQKEDFNKSIQYFTKSAYQSGNEQLDLKGQSLYNLALILMSQGDYSKANSHWDHYIKNYSESPQISGAFLHRGISYKQMKDFAQAKKDLIKAKNLSKDIDEQKNILKELKGL